MSYRGSLLLFADDFDVAAKPLPTVEPEPPVLPPPPAYGQEELDAACAEARAAGYAQGTADASVAEAARVAATLERIAEQLADAAASAAQVAEESAETLARLLLAAVVAGYPNLRTRFGEEELRALLRHILPGLLQESRVTIHVHPSMRQAVLDELSAVRPSERQHLTIEPSEAILPGDARVTWPHGAAVRDTANTAAAIADILGPFGLLPDPARDETAAEFPGDGSTAKSR